MGFLDDARKRLTGAVHQHGDKINTGIDKAAAAADKRTGGKHRDKIQGATGKAKDALGRLDDEGNDQTGGTGTPGTPQNPPR